MYLKTSGFQLFIHTSGMMEVILSDSGSAHPVHPCTKEQIPILVRSGRTLGGIFLYHSTAVGFQ